MVTKMIAVLSLCALAVLCSLGNYWYTFGLWPKSWFAFVGFFAMSSAITAAITAVAKDSQ